MLEGVVCVLATDVGGDDGVALGVGDASALLGDEVGSGGLVGEDEEG